MLELDSLGTLNSVQTIALRGCTVKQLTLSTNDFERSHKPRRRVNFLAEMIQVVTWAELAAPIEPYYSKASCACG